MVSKFSLLIIFITHLSKIPHFTSCAFPVLVTLVLAIPQGDHSLRPNLAGFSPSPPTQHLLQKLIIWHYSTHATDVISFNPTHNPQFYLPTNDYWLHSYMGHRESLDPSGTTGLVLNPIWSTPQPHRKWDQSPLPHSINKAKLAKSGFYQSFLMHKKYDHLRI